MSSFNIGVSSVKRLATCVTSSAVRPMRSESRISTVTAINSANSILLVRSAMVRSILYRGSYSLPRARRSARRSALLLAGAVRAPRLGGYDRSRQRRRRSIGRMENGVVRTVRAVRGHQKGLREHALALHQPYARCIPVEQTVGRCSTATSGVQETVSESSPDWRTPRSGAATRVRVSRARCGRGSSR